LTIYENESREKVFRQEKSNVNSSDFHRTMFHRCHWNDSYFQQSDLVQYWNRSFPTWFLKIIRRKIFQMEYMLTLDMKTNQLLSSGIGRVF